MSPRIPPLERHLIVTCELELPSLRSHVFEHPSGVGVGGSAADATSHGRDLLCAAPKMMRVHYPQPVLNPQLEQV